MSVLAHRFAAGVGPVIQCLTPPTAAVPLAGTLLIDPEAVAPQVTAVESGDRRARLVAFHLHEAEASAASRKDVASQFDRSYPTVFREKFVEFPFGGIG